MAKNIAVIPGDGTGPEVVKEGIRVLKAAANSTKLELIFETYDFGGDRYLRTGEVLPNSALDELRTFDAIYLGAIGHPQCSSPAHVRRTRGHSFGDEPRHDR